MPDICFYFQVHQPYRLKHYTFFEVGNDHNYGDVNANSDILLKVARKCYLPMNELLYNLILENKGRFKVSFSLSGTVIDQFENYMPEMITSFQKLVKTGCVEILSETYNHSLAYIYSKEEFKKQVLKHKKKIKELFNVEPVVFRNTELIYNNDLAVTVEEMGYKGVLIEGADHILDWRSPNILYKAPNTDVRLLLKNYKLSDDIAFRFSNQGWEEFPLTIGKYTQWIHSLNGAGELINLFMDYETFGEHQWESTGIFEFMKMLPASILANKDFGFITPSEALAKYESRHELDIPHYISWADAERDLSAWLSNDMQKDAIGALYKLEDRINTLNNKQYTDIWRRLQTSDHFYYMCTKWFSDGDVHKYFNPYGTPYDAYANYMNVLADFELRVNETINK